MWMPLHRLGFRIGCNIDGSPEVQFHKKCNTYLIDYLHFNDYAIGLVKVQSR